MKAKITRKLAFERYSGEKMTRTTVRDTFYSIFIGNYPFNPLFKVAPASVAPVIGSSKAVVNRARIASGTDPPSSLLSTPLKYLSFFLRRQLRVYRNEEDGTIQYNSGKPEK